MIDEGPFPIKERLIGEWWWLRYRATRVFTEKIPWWIAFHLPRKIALFSLVRLAAYASSGDRCGKVVPSGLTYETIYRAWEERSCD